MVFQFLLLLRPVRRWLGAYCSASLARMRPSDWVSAAGGAAPKAAPKVLRSPGGFPAFRGACAQFAAELHQRRPALVHVVGPPLDGLAFLLQIGHRLSMLGRHPLAYCSGLFGVRPLLLQQLFVERLGLGQSGLGFGEL